MKAHHLKLQTRFYDAAASMDKPFEVRFNDRDFRVGDMVCLQEVDENQQYTDRPPLVRKISFMLRDWHGVLTEGYVVLGLREDPL